MSKKKVKFIDRLKYNKIINEHSKNRANAASLEVAMRSFPECWTLEAVEEYLNTKTGFVNARLSASALGLEEEYEIINTYYGKIQLSAYNSDFSDLKEEFKKQQLEKCTEYWSAKDSKEIGKLEEMLKDINDLPTAQRHSLIIDRDYKLHFNENAYIQNLNFYRNRT